MEVPSPEERKAVWPGTSARRDMGTPGPRDTRTGGGDWPLREAGQPPSLSYSLLSPSPPLGRFP